MWSDWKLGLCVRMRCLRGGVEVLDMHTHVITFAQNDEPVQFYHHRIDLSYLIIEILACLPAGVMSRCYIWEHLSPLMYKSHKAQELPVTYYNRTTERSQERQKRGEGRHVVNGSGADSNPRSDTGHLMQLWKEWVRKNRLLYECLVFALHVFVDQLKPEQEFCILLIPLKLSSTSSSYCLVIFLYSQQESELFTYYSTGKASKYGPATKQISPSISAIHYIQC